jgi:hypothetical protein
MASKAGITGSGVLLLLTICIPYWVVSRHFIAKDAHTLADQPQCAKESSNWTSISNSATSDKRARALGVARLKLACINVPNAADNQLNAQSKEVLDLASQPEIQAEAKSQMAKQIP